MDLALKSEVLHNIKTVSHGFFTRRGGVSEGIYSGLNCGYGSNDDENNVQKNRLIVQSNLSASNLVTLYQIHSNKVLYIEEPPKEPIEADALVTSKRGLALGILTADCVPILFADKESGIIAAAHAGWKGASSGIVTNVIEAMVKMGAVRKNIAAAIGPSIAKCSYEVDRIFYHNHIAENIENRKYFTKSEVNPGYYHYDLSGFIISQLESAGVGAVDRIDVDTYTNEEDFYSYRRSTHSHEEDYGRQISAIVLK